jgi:signal transduction histidine kinase
VNDILDFSKLEAGAVELSLQQFRVTELVEGVVALLDDQAREKGLTLHASVPDDVALVGDAARLRQVLLNLVGNAVKFTASGSVLVEARCVPGSAGTRLRWR